MQGKELMSSFFAANAADAAITAIALNSSLGFEEKGVMGAPYAEGGALDTAIIIKMGVTSLLIGTYALAKTKGNESLIFSHEKALQVGNYLVWGAAVLNAAQVTLEYFL